MTRQVVVLVPAHNEENCIAGTLRSLKEQTRRPDRVVVVADNCTDGTVRVARDRGAEVFTTVGNSHKKAGALNQVLGSLLPTLGTDDAVLVMDADSELDSTWVESAEARLDAGYSACGGVFTGRAGGGLVAMFQRNEYARYRRDVSRRSGKTLVLTGTATLFKVGVLNGVVESRRSGQLPGDPHVYDLKVLTEDNELHSRPPPPRAQDYRSC